VEAQTDLGRNYEDGNGTTQNYAIALCCYNKAALEEKPREGKQTISVQTIR
jgi:TPR repeat protein